MNSHTQNAESIESLADRIVSQLSPITPLLGLVTAAHYAHLIPPLLEAIHTRRSFSDTPITVVYNSSGYESVETLRSLEGLIDIYLPDFKYMDSALAKAYSRAPNYPEVASAAINEMIRQVGIGLKTDDNGIAYRGIIVRHLVLPGHTSNSLAVLDHLASISSLHSPFSNLHLSLMAQYFPPHEDLPAPLNRTVSHEEYALVVHRAEELGFSEGWIQELTAQNNYRPDFTLPNPFQN